MRSVALPAAGRLLRLIFLVVAPLQQITAIQNATTAIAPADSPDKRCAISGHVTNSLTGEPLRKLSLQLLPAGTSAAWTQAADPPAGIMTKEKGYGATSDIDGSFQFENVEPGRYNLSGSRFGFLPTHYTGNSASKSAAVLALTPGQHISRIAVPLTPQAVVSGKVVDDEGDPVVGGIVQVTAQTWSRGKLRYLPKTTCTANDLGEFRCADLSPGKYYISTEARMDFQELPGLATTKPRPRPVRTYYPSSPSLSNATSVEIAAGQDVPGINIRMLSSQTFHVRGRVSGAHGSAYVMLADREETGQIFMSGKPSEVKPDGTFDIPNVTPGAYIANIMALTNQNVGMTFGQNVDVTSADVNNIALTSVNPGSLKGTILVEGTPSPDGSNPDLTNVRISLAPVEGSQSIGPLPSSEVNTDGTFLLSKIPAARYLVDASPLPSTYVKSIQYGQTEVLGSDLDLSGGASGELRVIYRYGAAEVEGKPKQPDQLSTSSTNAEEKLLLVQEKLNADGSGFHFARTDREGKFKFQDLAPGRYRLYAFEQVDFEEIQNPELLKLISDKGIPIELKEGEKRQIEPPLISSSDLTQILLRSGITQ